MANTTVKQTKKGKKAKVLAALMVFLLGGALFANWYINSAGLPFAVSSSTTSEDKLGEAQYVSATTAASDYFKESKLNREKTRDNTMSELSAVIESDKSTSDQKKKAVDTYAKLSERAELETDMEALICAKGVSVCMVVLGDKSCEVIVPESELNDTIAMQIKEIVANKSEIDAAHITVSTAK